MALARLCGWRLHHSRPAWVRNGKMVTALQGDKGLPDLILLRPPQLFVVELKTETGRISDDQRDWLQAFAQVPGVRAFIWRPSDLGTIQQLLGKTGQNPVG